MVGNWPKLHYGENWGNQSVNKSINSTDCLSINPIEINQFHWQLSSIKWQPPTRGRWTTCFLQVTWAASYRTTAHGASQGSVTYTEESAVPFFHIHELINADDWLVLLWLTLERVYPPHRQHGQLLDSWQRISLESQVSYSRSPDDKVNIFFCSWFLVFCFLATGLKTPRLDYSLWH